MLRDYKKIARLSYILIVAAIVLIALSVVFIASDSPESRDVSVLPGSSYHFVYNVTIDHGDYLFYSVVSNNSSANLTAYLITPAGTVTSMGNITGNGSLKKDLVAGDSGNWTLVLENNGKVNAYARLTVYRISYLVTYTIVFGISLFASGFILLLVSLNLRRREGSYSRRQRGLE
ncbi:MAG: hypothetical protein M1327_06435 [Candidatus Thermoplasmatota archaeon]|nr:hypothetical protein [Candidatus Thermoplasmatota archaeon]